MDLDSDDDNTIYEALSTLYSLLESMILSKGMALFLHIDKCVSVKDIIENSISVQLVNLLNSQSVDVLIILLKVIGHIYQQADKEEVLFVLWGVF